MEHLNLVKHRLGDAYRNAVSAVKTISSESKFIEAGTLTPEEFVEAGDQLAFKFPTWRWDSGDPNKRGNHLPDGKQFLITRNVPCRDRVRALDSALEQSKTDDDWLLPPETSSGSAEPGELQDVDDMAVGSSDGIKRKSADQKVSIFDAEDNFLAAPSSGGYGDGGNAPGVAAQPSSGLPDFSDLDAELQEDDYPAEATPAFGGGDYIVAEEPDAHIVKMRTYDLSITYDKYYQTPRLWLFGYNERGDPLTPEEVYEDVLSDYVSKTVTVDPHPLTGTPTVSIHPCKHAQVMKKVVADWIEQKLTPRPDLALFVFLKFISSVVPTINYDFTMEIEF